MYEMHMKFTYKLNQINLFSIVILLLCVSIPFFDNHYYDLFSLLVRMLLIFVYSVIMSQKKNMHPKIIFVLLFFYFSIALSTVFNKGDLLNLINLCSRSLLITLYCIFNYKNQKNFLCILDTWYYVLLILCLIDFISIILFPKGINIGSYYTLTWFLGYKTSRLVFSLPLVVLASYLSAIKFGKLSISVHFIIIFNIISAYLSQATAGYIALIIYWFLLLFLSYRKRKKYLLEVICNAKFVILSYFFIFILISFIQTNAFMQFIIQDILRKSSTLSYRTSIWTSCIGEILSHPLLGLGYLSSSQYVKLTQYRLGTSAHSMMLSYLMSGGVLCLFSYLCLVYKSLSFTKKNNLNSYTIKFGILCNLIIGLTSSSLAFSSFFTFFFILLLFENEYNLIGRKL